MSETDDRSTMIAAMYADDPSPKRPATTIETPGFSRTRKIRIGAIEYEVPTVEYVSRLEQLISAQARRLEQQQQTIDRLYSSLSATRAHANRLSGALNSLQGHLDRFSYE